MINIKETFLKLTKRLYPYGSEDSVIKLFPELPFTKDGFGNYYIIIKKDNDTYSDVMFTCHLDTVTRGPYKNEISNFKVTHKFEGDFIKTDGETNLGADDKAGMTIMLNMISENIPGLYYFFIGEESGGIGSKRLSKSYEDLIKSKTIPRVNKCISFDRRDFDRVTTFQKYTRCCSNKFAEKLSEELNEYGFWYTPYDNGGKTDSYHLISNIPECTNLSVGYFNEHTIDEMQDIEFLELLSVVVTKIDWESLPVEREIIPKIETDYSYMNDDLDENGDDYFDVWYNEQKEKSSDSSYEEIY